MSVRVKSVTIQGFKSFGERVRVEFTGKVNAVIGPNGSGKSNVIEAIRWASHTARTRELRVRDSSELIFHGSSGKAPLNLAEVILELENVSGSGAVNIARRIYRDGDSDLELHGKTVRVRDLHDVLRGSGLGPGGIAVVGQGEIGAVVGANPTTMMGYLEEAAGLSRATHRRAQSLERLEQARIHLERAEDLAREVRLRVAKLEQEAVAAGEYAGLTLELHSLEGALSRNRLRTLRDEIARLEREVQDTERGAETTAHAMAAATEALEGLRLTREEKQVRLAETAAESERLLGEARALRERAAAADVSLAALLKERGGLESELEGLAAQTVPTPPEPPSEDIAALETVLHQSREALREAERVDLQWRKDLADARIRRDRLELETRAQRETSARQQAERETLERDLNDVQTELASVAAARTEQQPQVDEARVELEAATKMLDRLEREAQTLSGRISDTGMRINELKGSRTPLQKEAARLEQIRQSRAYLSEGPRRAVQSGVEGIIGPVSDLLRVPRHLETAIGAALGRRVENIVVRSGEVAKAVIDSLKRTGGRATFLPLDILRSRGRRDLPITTEKGVLGFAAELVSVNDILIAGEKKSKQNPLETVLESLFGETLVIENLEIALLLARQYRDRPRFVTLEGELLESGGAVTGGRGRDSAGESFADARRLEETQAELDALQENLAKLEVALDEDRETATNAREAVKRSEARLIELRKTLESARNGVLQLVTRQESLETRETSLVAKLKGLQTVVAADGTVTELPDLAPLEAGLALATAAVNQRRDSERTADAALREGKSRLAVYAEQQRTFEQAMARVQQVETRAGAIRTRLEELHLLQFEWGKKLSDANPEIERLERTAAGLNLPERKAELDALETQRRSFEQELTRRTRELSDGREALEKLREGKSRREGNFESLQNELLEDELDDTERAAALTELLSQPDPEGTPRGWTTRVNAIRLRLDEIGAVNMLAAEEFQGESQRLHDLETGAADALASVAELGEALDILERDVTAKLRESIHRVTASFKNYIVELLGGEGDLELVRDEAGALEGLALRVTPKGKRTRNLQLLSAGERTMAALAFLFALSSAPEDDAGLPLAVLDEVDAPLDEANIRRFTHFLRLLADQGTQFILVTHQKATMEIADALWGVTTDASGTSRTFSIRNEDPALARA